MKDKNWYIKVTPENCKAIQRWRVEKRGMKQDITKIEGIIYVLEDGCWGFDLHSVRNKIGISDEEFITQVLGELYLTNIKPENTNYLIDLFNKLNIT